MNRRITITSIAEKAGVSIGSVSSVLNNRQVERRIAPETVERIRVAARELGYLPNVSARQLRTRGGLQNNIVVAWITSFEAPLNNTLPLALRETIARWRPTQGHMTYSVLIEMFEAGSLHELPGLLGGDHFNAAIITNTTPDDDRFLAENILPFPVVLVNREVAGYSCVVEEPLGGAEAAKALVGAKRKRIGVLHGHPITQATSTRVTGFLREAKAQLSHPPVEIVAQGRSEASASEAMTNFLDREGRLDGLYTVTDGMALGAYRALKQHKMRIPQDVAIIGTGDLGISNFFDPPLSTIGVPHNLVSAKASEMLIRQIYQPVFRAHSVAVLPLQKIMRASIGNYFPSPELLAESSNSVLRKNDS